MPRIEHEVPQQAELSGREFHIDATPAHLVRALVKFEVGEAEHTIVVRIDADATEDGLYPGDHLGQGEWLGDIVVPTDRQTGQLVRQRVAGGDEQDRNVDAIRPQSASDLESVQSGQHHVEDDEIRRIVLGQGEGIPAGRSLVYFESLVAKARGQRIDDGRFVIDDEYPWNGVGDHLPTSLPPTITSPTPLSL